MIITRELMKKQVRSNLKDGEGEIEFLNVVDSDTIKNCRLFSEMIVPSNCSVGDHKHINETECYVIQEGKGVVIDNGVKREIKKGDVIITGHGDSHSILNNDVEPLKMLALIVTH